jgi:hypothetical protein
MPAEFPFPRRCIFDRRQLLCGIALAAFACRDANAETAEPAGSVQDVKNEAFARSGKERRTLDRTSPIFVNDEVGTGSASRLKMLLGQDTKIALGERARLMIDRFLVDAGGEIVLGAGAIYFDRPSGSPPLAVQIRSLYGMIAVRGTRLFAGPSNGVFGVFVERGSVTVSAGGRQVILRSGRGTDIRAPGARPTAPKRWSPARIRAALDSVR